VSSEKFDLNGALTRVEAEIVRRFPDFAGVPGKVAERRLVQEGKITEAALVELYSKAFDVPVPEEDEIVLPEMREDVSQWAGQVGGLQEAEPSRRVDILNVQMRIKTEKDSMGSGQQAEVESEEVPLVREDGAEVRVLCGRWKDKVGPLEGLLAPETSFLDITLLPGAGESFPLRPQNNSWIYVFGGKGTFGRTGRKKFGRRTFLHINGSEAYVSTRCEGVRFLLFSAPRTEKELKNCTNGRAHICKATGIDFGNKKE